jgi:hypothetical protein
MAHALLLNPFNLNQEPAQNSNREPAQNSIRERARIASRRATRSTPVCSHCQSDDIISHATAQWSNESQEWELANTFGEPAHCTRCNGPCGIVWLPLN